MADDEMEAKFWNEWLCTLESCKGQSPADLTRRIRELEETKAKAIADQEHVLREMQASLPELRSLVEKGVVTPEKYESMVDDYRRIREALDRSQAEFESLAQRAEAMASEPDTKM